jgi:subtilisin family serine protease
MNRFPSQLTHSSGTSMALDRSRLLLEFFDSMDRGDAEARLRDTGLVLEDADDDEADLRARPFEFVNHTDRRYWVRSRSGEPIDQQRFDEAMNRLAGVVHWAAPVYRLAGTEGRGGLVCPLPDVLIIRPSGAADDGGVDLESRLREYGLAEVRERSRHLAPYRYFTVTDAAARNSYELRSQLLDERPELFDELHFEYMPMIVPIAMVPNDPLFPQQWDMIQIAAGGQGLTGWDITLGDPATIVCVLDSGCDLTHPDLNRAPGAAGQGINLGTMKPTGAPTGPVGTRPHGTHCAGSAVGATNNAVGISGVAGNCRLMPVAFQNWTDAECAAGINWASTNGARVISMSFGQYAPRDRLGSTGWNFALIDPAIANAVDVLDCVLVAATGNENTGQINLYPARNPRVIAVGASDAADGRKSLASPDGECWGSNFGPGVSVVAPGVVIPTTDIQGAGGYNANNGGPRQTGCVDYPVCGDNAGNYFFQFTGTSAATPHVAGLAALVRSASPTLAAAGVRDLIEQEADKVGGLPYANQPNFPNGTRNQQMGYGRINVRRTLDTASPPGRLRSSET